jgi:hypothetical protein
MFPWILGVNFHEIFAIIVLVISVLSWLVNLIQGSSPNAVPRQQRPKPKPQTSRSELESLIQELTTDKRKAEEKRRTEQLEPTASAPIPQQFTEQQRIEQRRAEHQRKEQQRAERARAAASMAPQRPGGPPPYNPSRQLQQMTPPKRKEPKRNFESLGEGIRSQHVGSQFQGQIKEAPSSAAETISKKQISAATLDTVASVHPLVKLLREPGGVRQAVILNEILQRPKSLRD